jgi:hypothetical protein
VQRHRHLRKASQELRDRIWEEIFVRRMGIDEANFYDQIMNNDYNLSELERDNGIDYYQRQQFLAYGQFSY